MTRSIEIDQPRYDQSTYWGRCQYFFSTTNPLNLFNSNASLEEAKKIITLTRGKKWSELEHLTDDDIWRAKELYDSAYHPDTGELMHPVGRMSAQVPMNMAITGCMMSFYKSTPAVVFWQWINQSFNALVNYTNRSGDAAITNEQIATSYVLATGGALATALGLNRMTRNAHPLLGRIVPFAAVAAANCINIPMMRMQEIKSGIPVMDENGNKVGDSKAAARAAIITTTLSRIGMASPGMKLTKGIPVVDSENVRIGESSVAARRAIIQTIISRNGISAPGMICTPIIMNKLDSAGVFLTRAWLATPLTVGITGVFLTFATPMCCALFEQKASISASSLEPSLRKIVEEKGLTAVSYNKGL